MTLLDRLQSATEGSRELDAEIGIAVIPKFLVTKDREGFTQVNRKGTALTPVWEDYNPAAEPHYTTNLQDAVSLALAHGANSIKLEWRNDELAKALIGFPWGEGVPFSGAGHTLAIACSAAIVTAHESRAETTP
jgi:hypothetical protein